MPSQAEYSGAFWLGYFVAVKGPWNPSSNTAIFVGQQGQQGPVGGSGVDERYTNYGIYQLADNLLRDDSLSYTPLQSNSYSRELLAFAENLDLGGQNNEPGPAEVAERLRQDQNPMSRYLQKMQAEAMEAFQQELDMGIARTNVFEQWAEMNAPAYTAAIREYGSGSSALSEVLRRAQGPAAEATNTARERIADALHSGRLQPGLTMQVAALPPPSAAASIRKAYQASERIPEPQGTMIVPAYSSPDLQDMFRWVDRIKGQPENERWEEFTIDYNLGSSVSKHSFGQRSLNSNTLFSVPWCGITAEGNTTSALSSPDQQKTSIVVKWTGRRLESVYPGGWDIKGSNFRLNPSAPESAKNLMRPTQLVCLNNLSYDIKFFGESVEEVEQAISKARRGEAEMRVFGWSVGVEGGGRPEEASHVAKWDKENGTLTISPQLYGSSVSVAAIVGEKVNS